MVQVTAALREFSHEGTRRHKDISAGRTFIFTDSCSHSLLFAYCNILIQSSSCLERHSQLVTRMDSYSHSIVPGGLLVMSYVTRLIPRTSLTIRVATRARNSMLNG